MGTDGHERVVYTREEGAHVPHYESDFVHVHAGSETT